MTDPLFALTVGDLPREHRRSFPERIASVCGAQRASWPELDERVTRLASALADRGVAPGDRIVWLGQNCHRLFEAFLAAAKLGAVFCPANWRGSQEELAFVLEDTAPSAVFWQAEELGEKLAPLRAADWIQCDGSGPGSYEGLLAAGDARDPERFVDPDAALLQLYTAAFDGRPNGALLSHRALLQQALGIAWLDALGADDVQLNVGPLFHVGTWMWTNAVLLVGGKNVFLARAEPEAIAHAIESERATRAMILPPTADALVALARERALDLSSLRVMGGSPEWRALTTPGTSPWLRHPNGYGQTELVGMASFNAAGGPGVGASGRPAPWLRLRVLREDGNECTPGEVGEIAVRGPTLMQGYHARPALDAARRRDGWHRTNDLGRRESDGTLHFVGPKARMLKCGAENVYPVELEQCLAAHPAVREAAVIGVPDARLVQRPKAIVVLRKGAAASEAELIEWCRARIASYKKPASVVFVSELPRRGFAVDYETLDAAYGGGNYPGGGTRSV